MQFKKLEEISKCVFLFHNVLKMKKEIILVDRFQKSCMSSLKVLAAVALFAVVALAIPQQDQQQPEVYILRHDSEVNPDGYQFA